MLDKKISVSEQVANLTIEAQLLFTWMIAHADDVGLLPYSARSIKGLVVPMNDSYTVETIGFHLETIKKAGLTEEFEWQDDKFWRLVSFSDHQTLKTDRKPNTIAKNLVSWNPKTSKWKTLESQGREVREEKEVSKEDDKKNNKGLTQLRESLKNKGIIK